jgi:hypothetical protein
MPDHSVFRHCLDLMVRLIDTTMGTAVTDRGVEFYYNGKRIQPLLKEPGSYILIGTGREDFELLVTAKGFEDKKVTVSYESLDQRIPMAELHLIPGTAYSPSAPCHTLKGTIPGLTELDAVKNGDSACVIREFDERKKLLTLFNPHRLELNCVDYAVVNPEDETFEPFEIKTRVSDQEFKISRKLEKTFGNHFPVCRIVHGLAGHDGSYLLRVRNNSSDARWMIRTVIHGEEQFCTIDFTQGETLSEKLLPAKQKEE